MYLLDTNVLSELIRRSPDIRVIARFDSAPTGTLHTSVICVEEIRYGTLIAPPGNNLWGRFVAEVLPSVDVIALTQACGLVLAELKAEQKQKGRPIGYADALIAATAKTHGLVLVTRNVKHFEPVSGLRVENWFESKIQI